ncbi:THO complex subunit 4-like isoform X2 [Paramacrobiotus metropolitanus]|nr:THO complex subunit 4-like isoform X2 [Paramacrobiotus metropolitanus]
MADVSLDDYIKSKHIGRGDKGRGGARGRTSARGSTGGGRGGFRRQGGFHSDITKNIAPRKQPVFLNRNNSGIQNRWQHDLFGSGAPGIAGLMTAFSNPTDGGYGTKLLISNLDFAVTETDLRELFGELGTVKKVSIHCDRNGASLGSAEVIYQRAGDAVNALQKYNGIPLDGRIMEIQLIGGNQPNVRGGNFMGAQSRLGIPARRAWADAPYARPRGGR